MSFWQYLALFIKLYPDIKRLIANIEKNAKERKSEETIAIQAKKDLGVINDAFLKRDSKLLRDLFARGGT